MARTPAPEHPGSSGTGAADAVVRDAAADPVLTHVRQVLADVGAQADVVVLDHPPRSSADLGREVGADDDALVRCDLLLVDPPGAAVAPWTTARAVLVVLLRDRALRTEVVGLVARPDLPGLRAATAAEVEELCGCAPADLPPVGLPLPGAAGEQHDGADALELVAVLVDVALAAQRVLWAPAGRPGTALSTSYAELLRITGARPVEIA